MGDFEKLIEAAKHGNVRVRCGSCAAGSRRLRGFRNSPARI